ncbi:MAG: preprotein translocase subunit SecG [Parvularculaceae bacterium]
MDAVLLTIFTLVVLALIGVVLLQRSDGGALGIGGGGGGGFMTGRGAANALTRTTWILGALFIGLATVIAIRAGGGEDADSIADELTGTEGAPAAASEPGELTTDDLLNSLSDDAAPADEEPEAATADEPAADSVEGLIEDLGGTVPEAAPADESAPADEQDENAPQQ